MNFKKNNKNGSEQAKNIIEVVSTMTHLLGRYLKQQLKKNYKHIWLHITLLYYKATKQYERYILNMGFTKSIHGRYRLWELHRSKKQRIQFKKKDIQ